MSKKITELEKARKSIDRLCFELVAEPNKDLYWKANELRKLIVEELRK